MTMKKLSARSITKNRLFELQLHDVQFPDGYVINDYLYLQVNPGVMVVAITTDQQLIFLEQYRYAVDETVLCLPGGLADSPEEELLSVAKRELEEETGFTAEQYQYLGEVYPLPGNNTNRTSVYLATDCQPNGHFHPESSEKIVVNMVKKDRLARMIQDNLIKDGMTLASLMLAWDHLEIGSHQ